MFERSETDAAWAIAALAAALALWSVTHHIDEVLALQAVAGPLAAFLLDGLPPLALGYAAYRLRWSDLPVSMHWQVARWTYAGAALFGLAFGLTILIRGFEGRPIAEPTFPLLVSLNAGALAGVVAGASQARARADARRAETISDALEFVNNLIRHDLRNDLNVIRGYASLVEADPSDPSARGERAATIARQTEEALTRLETTEDIVETLVGDATRTSVDLVTVTETVTEQIAATYDVRIDTSVPESAPVRANAGLRSVVDNVVENAVEHNDSPTPHVTLSIRTAPETVELAVEDDGPGIPEGLTAALAAEVGEEIPDSGLSLAATLIDHYDGDLRLEAGAEGGTRAVVELPRARGSENPTTA